jgi:hypothetical protein
MGPTAVVIAGRRLGRVSSAVHYVILATLVDTFRIATGTLWSRSLAHQN